MTITVADISFPLWLVVSQWVLLFALGLLVIVMYRQLGYLLHLRDVGTGREGLPIGEKAPAFDYTPVNGNMSLPARFEATGQWSLLVFVEPGCVSCRSTITALERLTPAFEQRIRVLAVTSAEPALIAAVDEFRTASLGLNRVSKDVPDKLYQTRSTPFAYLIDPGGMIKVKGIVTDEPAIRKLVQKVDRNPISVEFTPPKQPV